MSNDRKVEQVEGVKGGGQPNYIEQHFENLAANTDAAIAALEMKERALKMGVDPSKLAGAQTGSHGGPGADKAPPSQMAVSDKFQAKLPSAGNTPKAVDLTSSLFTMPDKGKVGTGGTILHDTAPPTTAGPMSDPTAANPAAGPANPNLVRANPTAANNNVAPSVQQQGKAEVVAEKEVKGQSQDAIVQEQGEQGRAASVPESGQKFRNSPNSQLSIQERVGSSFAEADAAANANLGFAMGMESTIVKDAGHAQGGNPQQDFADGKMDKVQNSAVGEVLAKEAELCDKCGSEMRVQKGEVGEFLLCTNQPACHHVRSIERKTGPRLCHRPGCGGEIVKRKDDERGLFVGCTNYPSCSFGSWTTVGKPR